MQVHNDTSGRAACPAALTACHVDSGQTGWELGLMTGAPMGIDGG